MNKTKNQDLHGNTNEIKNYGFKLNEVEDSSAWKLGAIELPKEILVSDGQWDNWLPSDELQFTPSYDTYGCSIYGTENVQQTLERRIYGKTSEYDERYNYNLVRIVPPGADPHDAAQSFKNDGVVSGLFPMTETLAEYATPRPMPTKYVAQGIAHPYELRHQWLWQKSIDKETRTRLVKEYLRYSPLGVSVTAWSEKNGIYVDNGQRNTHWVELYGWTDHGWKVFDSYAPHRKILSFDHNIEVCKRYILVLSTRKAQLNVLSKFLQIALEWLGLINLPKPPTNLPIPPPITPPEPVLTPTTPSKYLWGTKEEARHSVRVICDEMGLSVEQKNILCATVGAESGWNPKAVGKINSDGTRDYGIAQINTYYWIGGGKQFPSTNYVLTHPEECIRWMCKMWKAGKQNYWSAYNSGAFAKFL